MTALRLFDVPATEVETVTTRAYCPHCGEFTVTPETDRCTTCGKPKDRRFQYVEFEEEE